MREQPQSFQSLRPPELRLADSDLAAEPLFAWTDLSGRTVGRYFPKDGKLVALREHGYLKLRRLTEKIARTKPFSDRVSKEFIEDATFRWWRATLCAETSQSLADHLIQRTEASVKAHRILIPLSNLEIERPFNIGIALISPIDPQIFKQFALERSSQLPDQAPAIRAYADALTKDFGHLTAVTVDIVGEVGFARSFALGIAFDVADILRFMCPVAPLWNVPYACFPRGYEHQPKTTTIALVNDRLIGVSNSLLNQSHFHWKLSSHDLTTLMDEGFRKCDVLISNEPLTGFQQRVKVAISAYSQGVASNDIRHRLIYAMSAAEHLLLRDQNEPIQTSVGERIAFLIAKEPKKRLAVVANFKKAYGLRSRQIHHLATIDDEEVLSEFFANMFLMLTTAMDNILRFGEHKDFLEAIDQVKFS